MSSGNDRQTEGSEAALEARRRELSAGLAEVKAHGRENEKSGTFVRDSSGLAQAMKLSAEFVGGVAAGAFLGWGIDYVAGSSPWGLIVCTLLGFGAGMMNMMRSSGALPGFGKTKMKR